MNELAYLLGAIALSVAGSSFIWYRHGRPKTVEAGVEQFHRGLQALESTAAAKKAAQ